MRKKTNRLRIHCKKTPSTINKSEIIKEIKKETKTKKGLSASKILKLMKCFPNFLGCYAQDQLKTLCIRSLPIYLIVNFDHSGQVGSHWIALRIDKRKIEIFDPLGFNAKRWPKIPLQLIDFLHKFSLHRKVCISREIQPTYSTLCGFYCIYFIYCRHYNTSLNCTNNFSKNLIKNDDILINLFNKI